MVCLLHSRYNWKIVEGIITNDSTYIIAKKLLTTILSVALLAGCAPTTKKESSTPKETPKVVEPVDVNVAALKGPTSMGMVQMMKENDEGKITSNNY